MTDTNKAKEVAQRLREGIEDEVDWELVDAIDSLIKEIEILTCALADSDIYVNEYQKAADDLAMENKELREEMEKTNG